MSKLNQKSAVYAAITNVLNANNISFEDGMNVKEHMSKEIRAQVSVILVAGFQSETIELDKVYETEALLKSYVSGLITNWINKDKRFNGNTKHVAKNPGSKAGSSDAQVKALRALLATTTDNTARTEIQSYLDTRLAELNASKPKQVMVNLSDLPEALRMKYSA